MSWENEVYTLGEKPPAQASTPRSKSRSRVKSAERKLTLALGKLVRENMPQGIQVLDLHGKGLTEIPVSTPDYADAKFLVLRDNNLTKVDMAKLPRGLIALDVRRNKINEFLNIDAIPKSLETIHFDNNKFTEHPPLPKTVNFVSSSGNPFKNPFQEILEGLPDRSTIWFHKVDKDEKPTFTEEEISGKKFILKMYDEETMLKIMGYADGFVKSSICHSVIEDEYISSKLIGASNLLVEVVGGEVVALSIFNILSQNIYIKLHCSAAKNRGGGSRLMKILIEFMNIRPNIRSITLESLYRARGFYEKLGFQRCQDYQVCPMELKRSVSTGGGRFTRKIAHRRKTVGVSRSRRQDSLDEL